MNKPKSIAKKTLKYPDGVVTDEIEHAISVSLPHIPSLDKPSLLKKERISLMDEAIALSRTVFVEKYGDSFGCEGENKSHIVEGKLSTPLNTGYQTSIHDGFCKLCWNFPEEQMAELIIEKRISNRKHVNDYSLIPRPIPDENTFINAKKVLEKIIDESNTPESPPLEQLLHSQAYGYNYQLLQEKGLRSPDVQENLLDRIEQCLIDREWDSQVYQWDKVAEAMDNPNSNWPRGFIRRFSIKSHKPGQNKDASKNPSNSFCPDHNPCRSVKSRRKYQNDRKRIAEFENELNRLYSRCSIKEINRLYNEDPLFQIDTLDARQTLRKIAYDNVFSSTLKKIKQLKTEGRNQSEIADTLKITRQAVSNALRRDKTKV